MVVPTQHLDNKPLTSQIFTAFSYLWKIIAPVDSSAAVTEDISHVQIYSD